MAERLLHKKPEQWSTRSVLIHTVALARRQESRDHRAKSHGVNETLRVYQWLDLLRKACGKTNPDDE